MPVVCQKGHVNEVDYSNLDRRNETKLEWDEGYTCSACGEWNVLFHSNIGLHGKLRELETMKPTHPSFWWYFVKARKRAMEAQKKRNNG